MKLKNAGIGNDEDMCLMQHPQHLFDQFEGFKFYLLNKINCTYLPIEMFISNEKFCLVHRRNACQPLLQFTLTIVLTQLEVFTNHERNFNLISKDIIMEQVAGYTSQHTIIYIFNYNNKSIVNITVGKNFTGN